jgi:hypothetical protein
MRRIFALAALTAMTIPVAAQDTYENARLLGSDLNGTARYVGMGGALEALGADISTISTNPAGIGLFRRSNVSVSFGLVSQQDCKDFDNLGKTNMSFDQAGFVYSNRTGENSYLNFAFNYHKSRNFDQILSAANNEMRGASMSKLAFGKGTKDSDTNGGYYWDTNTQNEIIGWRNQNSNERAWQYTQWDYLYFNTIGYDKDTQEALFVEAEPFGGENAYVFDRAHRGWISDFDFNMSGNIHDRVFLGITIGVHSVNYKGVSNYSEHIVAADGHDRGWLTLADERKITGTGADIKAGAIFRPIEDSPFRFGLSISTPTWYDLKSENWTTLYNYTDSNWGYDNGNSSEVYNFKYYTPWKFGLSLGHTIGSEIALGASYEFTDYTASDTRVNDGYDYYGNRSSYSDHEMKSNAENSLKSAHLLKLGAEFKPDPSMAVRLGYNYVSPMYNKNGYRDSQLNSMGNMYASTADYTNWEDTHRLTCGFGYKYQNLNVDLAYQYSTTKGQLYPFQPNVNFVDPVPDLNGNPIYETNFSAPTSVSHKRHQVLLSLTYTF